MSDKKPSTSLLGVYIVKPDPNTPETDLQLRRGKGDPAELRDFLQQQTQQPPTSPDYQLTILRCTASGIMKEAAIAALRDSVARTKGEHLHLEKPDEDDTPPITPESSKSGLTDPFKTRYARTQELMALASELADETYHDLAEAIREAVDTIYENPEDTQLACVYLERALINAGDMLRIFSRVNVRDNPAYQTLQKEGHAKVINTVIYELFSARIQEKINSLESADDRVRFHDTFKGLVEMFFPSEKNQTRQ